MTTYFSQESEPAINVNGRVFFDPHGNIIKLDENDVMVIERLEESGISPPSIFPHLCSICHKQVKTKGFSHYRCRDVVAKLEKAKKTVCNLEFKLFCLKYTDNDRVNLDIHNIE